MEELSSGLYETLITQSLAERLQALDKQLRTQNRYLAAHEASDRLALHLSRCLKHTIDSFVEKDRVEKGLALTTVVLNAIEQTLDSPHAIHPDQILEPGKILHTIADVLPTGEARTIQSPKTPLLDTTLLTNGGGDPNVGAEIATEIDSADQIDVVMAFVRYSGIRPFMDALHEHTKKGRSLRLLTTTYTGSTEARALDALREIGADIRVSYDTSTTRLHAKAWLFQRRSGYSTAYIGSSNLTHSALVDGIEWNVRASQARNSDIIDKVRAVFDTYWADDTFIDYCSEQFEKTIEANKRANDNVWLPPTEVTPKPFQSRLLEQIALARHQGRHQNLLVSATGTGKTVMAALDYASQAIGNNKPTLLFVAHRKEILQQAKSTFCHVLRDSAFGELWVEANEPRRFEHVFASIQSLNSNALDNLKPDQFDIVIIDEFHHAAANSYQRLLNHLEPKELLGLTATPERADGLSVLDYFGGRVAAEFRLWDAIDQQELTPFAYYGIADETDLSKVKWRRGQGYDIEELTGVLTADDAIARRVIHQLKDHVADINRIRALGFCVSIVHAQFMAKVFTKHGIRSLAVWGDTPDDERRAALEALSNGDIQVLFSVDLFNEGVDIPSLDTLLMLRPTQSGTLFIQQLGRGLRRYRQKPLCTVLDFVANHRKEFRYDLKLRALLGGSRKQLQRQVEQGFPFLPSGCHLKLDPVAQRTILNSLKNALPNRWSAKADELKRLDNPNIKLEEFLDETGFELSDVYTSNKGWSDLKELAGLPLATIGPLEPDLRRAIGRLLHIDDPVRLNNWHQWLSNPKELSIDSLSTFESGLLRMLLASILGKHAENTTTLSQGWKLLTDHPQVLLELCELIEVLRERLTHLTKSIEDHDDVPLQIHARYTRLEILAACMHVDLVRTPTWREGTRHQQSINTDLLAFTLDKSAGGFSPTTRYRDYAISRSLVHWESQNATREESPTGIRYQQHASTNNSIMLFARERGDDRAFWFLGLGTYKSHEGECPMAITWQLSDDLPGDLYVAFTAAVA